MAGIITQETIDILTKEYQNWLNSEFSQLIMLHINELIYGLQQEKRGSSHEYDIKLQTTIDCYKNIFQIPYDVYRKQLDKYKYIIDKRKEFGKEEKEPKSPV